jgi:hypothetical protein
VTVTVGIAIQRDVTELATVQDVLFFVRARYLMAKDTSARPFVLATQVGHAPGGPEFVHGLSRQQSKDWG